jgi:hypothetical protein
LLFLFLIRKAREMLMRYQMIARNVALGAAQSGGLTVGTDFTTMYPVPLATYVGISGCV